MAAGAVFSVGSLPVWRCLHPPRRRSVGARTRGALVLAVAAVVILAVLLPATDFISNLPGRRAERLGPDAISTAAVVSAGFLASLPAIADDGQGFSPNMETDGQVISDDFFNDKTEAATGFLETGDVGQTFTTGAQTALGLASSGEIGQAWTVLTEAMAESNERFWQRWGDGDPAWEELGTVFFFFVVGVNVVVGSYYFISWIFGANMRKIAGYDEFPDPFKEGTRAARAAAATQAPPQKSTFSRPKKKKKVVKSADDLFLPPKDGESMPPQAPVEEGPPLDLPPSPQEQLAAIRASQAQEEENAPRQPTDKEIQERLEMAEKVKDMLPTDFVAKAGKRANTMVGRPREPPAEK
eukprot:TRINITY_DN4861_c0_g1_i1.p1 TRINITY_DN4861_c0_g1~~TRINITY_DN4861_c0_g1_i1.p1  ORF type:complete len:372 (-),score=60.19 TRINITY_DN4861_c0_g1_i1:404-1465(-)